LCVPRFRNGQFSTEMFARYQRSEHALVLTLMEMVISGVSTRKISQITEELCSAEFSKSTVSDLCKKLDPLVNTWNNRELRGTPYPFVLGDALVLKVREEGRARSRGVMIAIGIDTEGYRKILGSCLATANLRPVGASFSPGLKTASSICSKDAPFQYLFLPNRQAGQCGSGSADPCRILQHNG